MNKIFADNKFRFLLLLAIVFFATMYLLFNNYGVIKYLKLKSEVNELNEKIQKLEEENKNLMAEIDSIKKGYPSKIEKIAREKYDMIKPNEKKIEFKEE
ncbi:MAG: FtsB family cell division protein [Ignavibacterium sp.]|uniref:FtsB family cell division protein n=1 Tax=Ignavibacterium sp. TaxID=2651167 RepID=UPI00404B5D00